MWRRAKGKGTETMEVSQEMEGFGSIGGRGLVGWILLAWLLPGWKGSGSGRQALTDCEEFEARFVRESNCAQASRIAFGWCVLAAGWLAVVQAVG